MAKVSAGWILYRRRGGALEVLLVHPGGPYWAKKDDGAWSIPKGEVDPGESPLAAARRELEEETGLRVGEPELELAPVRQPGGKIVRAWASRGDADAASLRSRTFEMEWPPRSGRTREFPEIDRAAWFDLAEARKKILRGQSPFLDELEARAASEA